MTNKEKESTKGRQHTSLLITSAILILSILISSGLVGCGPLTEDLEAVDYTPLPGDDWEVSTPEAQGLDPMLVAEMYHDAAELETIYSLLVITNGYLIAEDYFNSTLSIWESSRNSKAKGKSGGERRIAAEMSTLTKKYAN